MRRRLAHPVEYVALRGVEGVLRLLGLDRASAAMGWIWRHVAPLNPRHSRADHHLALAMPELGRDERRRILGDMWENLGRTAAEAVLLPELVAEPDRITCDLPPDTFERARGGAIFVSLHTGNWEVVSLPLREAGIATTGVYKPLRNPLVEDYLLAKRRPIYAGGLLGRERGVALKLRKIARDGGVLAILADQRDGSSIPIDFFGQPARAMPIPAILARRLDRPLFIGRCIRTRGVHFRVEGRWLAVPHTDDPEADVVALTEAIHRVYEEWIRQYPEQWMWAHRKWL